jgi:hypothetical protein
MDWTIQILNSHRTNLSRKVGKKKLEKLQMAYKNIDTSLEIL